MARVGIISDTHGLLRPQALEQLAGSDHIIHAGDIGKQSIVEALRALAPLTAVRGNIDRAPWALSLPEMASLRIGGLAILVLHDLAMLDRDPVAAGVRVLVCGHSHRPRIEERAGVLLLNPGSAGPRRFNLPITLAELCIDATLVEARIITLDPGPAPAAPLQALTNS